MAGLPDSAGGAAQSELGAGSGFIRPGGSEFIAVQVSPLRVRLPKQMSIPKASSCTRDHAIVFNVLICAHSRSCHRFQCIDLLSCDGEGGPGLGRPNCDGTDGHGTMVRYGQDSDRDSG